MDYEAVAEAISGSFCVECMACFPELAEFCDNHTSLITDNDDCKPVIEQYLKNKTRGLN